MLDISKTDIVCHDGRMTFTAIATDSWATIAAVQNFYSFWDSAEQRYLDAAITKDFVDHTHVGRAPGWRGLIDAASAFHAKVKDFHIVLDRLIVCHPFVTVQGQGMQAGVKAFDFTDVLKVDETHFISDNWPVEGPNVVTH